MDEIVPSIAESGRTVCGTGGAVAGGICAVAVVFDSNAKAATTNNAVVTNRIVCLSCSARRKSCAVGGILDPGTLEVNDGAFGVDGLVFRTVYKPPGTPAHETCL